MAITDSPSAAVLSAPSVLRVVDSARPTEALSVDELDHGIWIRRVRSSSTDTVGITLGSLASAQERSQ